MKSQPPERPAPAPFPRWLSWLVLLVLAYLIYESSRIQDAPPNAASPSVVPVITQQNYPGLAEMTDGEQWKRRLNPDYAAKNNCMVDKPKTEEELNLKVIEDVAGEGNGAACGETISIHLTVWGADGSAVSKDSLKLSLGSRELASGLDAGLVGIRPGGVRTLTLPPSALIRNKTTQAPTAALKALPKNKLTVVTIKRVE